MFIPTLDISLSIVRELVNRMNIGRLHDHECRDISSMILLLGVHSPVVVFRFRDQVISKINKQSEDKTYPFQILM